MGGIPLIELFKDMSADLPADAASGIRYFYNNRLLIRLKGQRYSAAGRTAIFLSVSVSLSFQHRLITQAVNGDYLKLLAA